MVGWWWDNGFGGGVEIDELSRTWGGGDGRLIHSPPLPYNVMSLAECFRLSVSRYTTCFTSDWLRSFKWTKVLKMNIPS